MIIARRMTAEIDGDFCVFLIGMRINRWWKVHKWMPVAFAMPRMIRELRGQPELGFLGAEQWFGNPTVMLQYWASFEALEKEAPNATARRTTSPATMRAAPAARRTQMFFSGQRPLRRSDQLAHAAATAAIQCGSIRTLKTALCVSGIPMTPS